MSLAWMVETTAVQSVQVSAMATARRAEENRNALMGKVNIFDHKSSPSICHQKERMDTFMLED